MKYPNQIFRLANHERQVGMLFFDKVHPIFGISHCKLNERVQFKIPLDFSYLVDDFFIDYWGESVRKFKGFWVVGFEEATLKNAIPDIKKDTYKDEMIRAVNLINNYLHRLSWYKKVGKQPFDFNYWSINPDSQVITLIGEIDEMFYFDRGVNKDGVIVCSINNNFYYFDKNGRVNKNREHPEDLMFCERRKRHTFANLMEDATGTRMIIGCYGSELWARQNGMECKSAKYIKTIDLSYL
jgi:hypothetical protein